MLTLRPHQQAAVESVYDYLRRHDDNPAVVLPTAAGKSWSIVPLAKDAVFRWEGQVLVLAHVKELLEQNAAKIRRLCRSSPIGVHSASLNRRDTEHPAIVAGIQSVYKRACELDAFDLVIVDEAQTAIAPAIAVANRLRQLIGIARRKGEEKADA
jgi:DNA repair protein RadD